MELTESKEKLARSTESSSSDSEEEAATRRKNNNENGDKPTEEVCFTSFLIQLFA
jgi:hypothetical protein